jgi:hypothetical protein
MDSDAALLIARRLAPAVFPDSHTAAVAPLAEHLEQLPDVGEDVYVAEGATSASLLTPAAGGHVIIFEATAEAQEDEEHPAVRSSVAARSLLSDRWTVGFESERGELSPGHTGLKTQWTFVCDGETVLTIEGMVETQPGDALSEGEQFARKLAQRVDFPVA